MRIAVTGGRTYGWMLDHLGNIIENEAETWFLYDCMEKHFKLEDTLIHGAAKGADSWAANWAKHTKIHILAFKANWTQYGRAAGTIRNIEMLEVGKPELVLAFPGGIGTAHMVKESRRRKVEVIECTP